MNPNFKSFFLNRKRAGKGGRGAKVSDYYKESKSKKKLRGGGRGWRALVSEAGGGGGLE